MKQIHTFIAVSLTALACCLVSCNQDDDSEEEYQLWIEKMFGTYYKYATKVNKKGETVLEYNNDNIRIRTVIPAATSKYLYSQGTKAILLLASRGGATDIEVSPEIKSQNFSDLVLTEWIYPHDMPVFQGDSISHTIECKDLDGLDFSYYTLNDKGDIKSIGIINGGKISITDSNIYSHCYCINGRLDVLSTDTVAIEAKSDTQNTVNGKSTLTYNYGTETSCQNPLVLKAIKYLTGANTLESSVVVENADASYKQEVITLKITSGKKSYEAKVYRKAF